MSRGARVFAAVVLVAVLLGIAGLLVAKLGAGSGGTTTSEAVNALIDNLQATGQRLLDLPLVVLLLLVAILVVLAQLALAWLRGPAARTRVAGIVLVTTLCVVAFGLAVAADRKIANLQDQVLALKAKASAAPLPEARPLEAASAPHSVPAVPGLLDLPAVRDRLLPRFANATLTPLVTTPTLAVVELAIQSPRVVAFLAAVDLRDPELAIAIGARFDKKTLTTEFATEAKCELAINGEAGNSPAPYSGLGNWQGNLIVEGVILLEERAGQTRPFLTFDRRNHGAFVSARAPERTPDPRTFHAIWGRWDVLLHGQVVASETTDRQPRTAMAIDAKGERLFLMVVDGRQQRHSVGAQRAEVGAWLAAFGASDAMLCDEGGSSCLFVASRGGIVNVPSDFQGQERPTYTHFGIARRGSGSRPSVGK